MRSIEEDYNQLQQEVAQHVREGRRDDALEQIATFRSRKEKANLVLNRGEVTAKLEELRRVEAEVKDALEGADQLNKRNLLSKRRQIEAYDGRCQGSKRLRSN